MSHWSEGYTTNIGYTLWYYPELNPAAQPPGNDFNPVHAACARQLGEVAGHGVQWFDDSFEEYLARQDLPDFDFIVLHGIWSWIADKDRKHIVEFLRRKLKVGGEVYIIYNTLPGWGALSQCANFCMTISNILPLPMVVNQTRPAFQA